MREQMTADEIGLLANQMPRGTLLRQRASDLSERPVDAKTQGDGNLGGRADCVPIALGFGPQTLTADSKTGKSEHDLSSK